MGMGSKKTCRDAFLSLKLFEPMTAYGTAVISTPDSHYEPSLIYTTCLFD
jgi:hypothetical protein